MRLSDKCQEIIKRVLETGFNYGKTDKDEKIRFMAQIEIDPENPTVLEVYPLIRVRNGKHHFVKAVVCTNKDRADRFDFYMGEDLPN